MVFRYSDRKNEWLIQHRNISFEDAIGAITSNGLLADIVHPNQEHYPGQRIMVIRLHEYSYCMPYSTDGDEIHLKTLYPSRKFRHLVEGDRSHE